MRRYQRRRQNAINLVPVCKGRPNGLAGFDGAQEILGLDYDLVLISCSMPRPLTKRLVIGMRGIGQDLGLAAVPIGPVASVQPKRVLIFLIKPDRALCP